MAFRSYSAPLSAETVEFLWSCLTKKTSHEVGGTLVLTEDGWAIDKVETGKASSVTLPEDLVMFHTHPSTCAPTCTYKRVRGNKKRNCKQAPQGCGMGTPSSTDIVNIFSAGFASNFAHLIFTRDDGAYVVYVMQAAKHLVADVVTQGKVPKGGTPALARIMKDFAGTGKPKPLVDKLGDELESFANSLEEKFDRAAKALPYETYRPIWLREMRRLKLASGVPVFFIQHFKQNETAKILVPGPYTVYRGLFKVPPGAQ